MGGLVLCPDDFKCEDPPVVEEGHAGMHTCACVCVCLYDIYMIYLMYIYMSSLYVCPHTFLCVLTLGSRPFFFGLSISLNLSICVCVLVCVCPDRCLCLPFCPHTAIYISHDLMPHTSICVLILLYTCPTLYVSSYYYLRVPHLPRTSLSRTADAAHAFAHAVVHAVAHAVSHLSIRVLIVVYMRLTHCQRRRLEPQMRRMGRRARRMMIITTTCSIRPHTSSRTRQSLNLHTAS